MPYKEGTKWRAAIMLNGERRSCLKDTKEEAKRWEVEEKKRIVKSEKTLKKEAEGLDLFELSVKYLEFADV